MEKDGLDMVQEQLTLWINGLILMYIFMQHLDSSFQEMKQEILIEHIQEDQMELIQKKWPMQ